ncbi:MAG: amphi-Trp domain-containing protein [Planctomycetes bacterium]|nr:amphi-Trp domain-containing protein [Planctomycetota bacterium]
MGKKNSFEHESLQDRESIVAYLEALTAGLRAGQVRISQGDQELILEPEGLLTLGIRAVRKRDRTRLDLRISWLETDQIETDQAPLEISGPKAGK